MLKIVICDDDKNYREIIVEFVNKIILDNKLNASVVFESGDYEEMDLFIDTNKADLYILDIDLGESKDKNGVSLGRLINQKSKGSFILYITGSSFTINELFEVKAYNCITKPFDLDYFECQFLNIYNEYVDRNNKVDLTVDIQCCDHKTYMIKCSNIVYVEKVDNICMIHLYNGKVIETHDTLKNITSYCGDKLIQTHKSFLCNSKYIHMIDNKNGKITMETGDIVLIGGKYKDNMRYVNPDSD